jgi:hypothetical protein
VTEGCSAGMNAFDEANSMVQLLVAHKRPVSRGGATEKKRWCATGLSPRMIVFRGESHE